MPLNANDVTFMQRAIALAELGRYTTAPNPNVGAVIVKHQQIVGEGYHRQAGGPHAEVFALRQAADAARGATCYVTLEPCSHYGRTPPCALALIEAGVQRVVIAMQDPNPQVAGRGIQLLQDAGIEVEVGLCAAEAAALNPGFLHKMSTKQPWIRLKMAASVDGAIALSNGQSQWLTGAAARADVQLWRAQSCAILSTATTVLADQAQLNVRSADILPLENGQLRQPLRIILDRQGRLTGQEPLFQTAGDILIIYPPGLATPLHALSNAVQPRSQISIATAPLLTEDKFDLTAVFALLATYPLNTIWVEAGSTLAAELWRLQLIHEFILYQAPLLLGGGALSMMPLAPIASLAEAPRWQWQQVTMIGDDVRLIARLRGDA